MSPVKDVLTYIATIENFRTLAQKSQDELLQPQVGREAYNLRFDDTYGSIAKRLNRSKYGSMSSLGTARLMGAYRYYKNSTNAKKQIVAYSTFLKVGNDSTGSFANVATGLTAGARWTWQTYKDLCYGFNGVDSNQVYDGTNNCETMGVPIPSAPVLVIGAATGLTGNYYYKVTYELDDYQEGSASDASAIIAPSNQKVNVMLPVSTNTRVTARTIYRTAAGGSIYYYLTRVANNAYTDYEIDYAEYANDGAAQAAWVTNGVTAAIELDYMEYATDGAAQTAYVTDDTGTSTLTQSQTAGGTNGGCAWTAGENGISQGFKTATIDEIIEFNFSLKYATSISGTLTGYIYSDDGSGKPNTAVATFSNRPASDLTTDYADIEFTGSYTPVVGTQYHMVVIWTSGTNGDIIYFDMKSGNPYADGFNCYRVTATWNDQATYDVNFDLYQNILNLQSYSGTVKSQGTYSLKGVALITDSLNKTLTYTIGSPIDLTGVSTVKFDIYASRTGANIKIGIHDSGGTTTEKTYTVLQANTWEAVTWDISAVSNANKDAIDSIIITIVNADAANTFYIDNFRVDAINDLQSYSGTVKSQGTYSLKFIAAITDSLNNTLTFTPSPNIDLTGVNTIYFDIYALRTGANIKIGIHDSGGTTTEKTYTVLASNTWETVTWDISGVSTANKNAIDSIIITIVNADAANTVYIDNIYYQASIYIDYIADGSLDTTVIAPTDYGAPEAYKLSVLHKSRFFLARNATYKSRVIYNDVRSGTSYPDVYPALNYFDILKDNGEELTFIGEDNYGQLIAMKPSAVVKINTDTDDPVGWSGFNSVISINGCIAPYSAAKTHVGLIFVSRYGEIKKRLVVWNGGTVQPIFEELEPIITAIPDTHLADIIGKYHNGFYYLTYNDGTQTYNNKALIVDLINNSWCVDNKNVDCFCSWGAGNDWGELYTGTSDGTGFLYREDTTTDTSNDLIHCYKSELDLGTVDACITAGTETVPTLILVKAELDTQVGVAVVSTLTGDPANLVSGYESEEDNETVSPSCTYLSPIIQVNAKNLFYLYWDEVIGTGGSVRFWIRTGDTTSAVNAASWSGPYSTASGSDISGVTAAKYIQYRIKMYVQDTDDYAGTYLKRSTLESPNDFVVKITFGFGTAAETAIAMEYIGHWDDFGWINAGFKRVRKRMRAMRIEFERTAVSGVLTFGYYKDYGTRVDVNLNLGDTDPKTGRTYAEQGYWNYNFPLGVYFNKWRHRIYNNDDDDLLIKRISYTLSPEPYTPIL